MALITNPFRKGDMQPQIAEEIPFPSTDAAAPLALLAQCPAHGATPLSRLDSLAEAAGISAIFAKDETARMGLGSFKALGAAYVIAHAAAATGAEDLQTALQGRTYVTASAGNHGLSVAAGARTFGAGAVIYLAETVPAAFADRLRAKGAEVRVEGAEYEASMAAAGKAAEAEGMILLSDSSWEGYYALPHRLMEGYLASGKEITDEMEAMPTHIFLQAGVGGLAGAMAAHFRAVWGDAPAIVVVEPEAAPALMASIEAGRAVHAPGPVSNMGRLDCKEPSLIALKGLARDADFFMTISDAHAAETVAKLAVQGIASTPSGVAGLAGILKGRDHPELGLGPESVALCIISEGAEA